MFLEDSLCPQHAASPRPQPSGCWRPSAAGLVLGRDGGQWETATWCGKAGRLDNAAKKPKPGPESRFWLLLMVGRGHLVSVVHSSKLGSSELSSDTVLPGRFTLASPGHPVGKQGHIIIILLLLESPTQQSHAALCHVSLTGPDCIWFLLIVSHSCYGMPQWGKIFGYFTILVSLWGPNWALDLLSTSQGRSAPLSSVY